MPRGSTIKLLLKNKSFAFETLRAAGIADDGGAGIGEAQAGKPQVQRFQHQPFR